MKPVYDSPLFHHALATWLLGDSQPRSPGTYLAAWVAPSSVATIVLCAIIEDFEDLCPLGGRKSSQLYPPAAESSDPFFFSGAAGLIYQVAWAKALGLVLGHTTDAVATVLAVFMAGLAAGSAYLGRWGQHHAHPIALYARIEFLVAATAALSLAGLARAVRSLYVAAYPAVGGSQPLLLALRFFSTTVVLFIPTFLMGGTVPILFSSLARDSAELSI